MLSNNVINIFPNDWDLDFSNNNNFYRSGVEKIKQELEFKNIDTNFIFKEEGKHNETHWNPILKHFLSSI